MGTILKTILGFLIPTIGNAAASKAVGVANGLGSMAFAGYLLANIDKTVSLTYTYGELVPFVAGAWWVLEVMRRARPGSSE